MLPLIRRLLFILLFMIGIVTTPLMLAGKADAPSETVAPITKPAPLTNEEIGKRIDALLQAWNAPGMPGAAIAVIDHGKLVFEKGYGLANLEYDAPIKPDTVFHVASVSKQFTAMAIVLLEGDRKLSIDDDVHKYLPELPDYGARITLRNLLQHTSGIRDQWQLLSLAGWSMRDVISQEQILRVLFRQKELNFQPGTQHMYCNSGYTLLAEIVTRVSGKPFPLFCAERIFQPLGMTKTHFHQDLTQIVPGRAYSYEKTGDHFEARPLNYANVGATSLFSTAEDLVKWLDNFRNPLVGGATAIARLQEQCVLSDGRKIDYALGLALGTQRGLRTLAHGGADAGFRSFVYWFPDQQLGIAVLSNVASMSPGWIADQISNLYLEDKMTPEPPKPGPRTFVKVEQEELKAYVGVYYFPKYGDSFEVVVDGGKLVEASPNKPEFKPTGPGCFFFEPYHADIEFVSQPDGGMIAKVKQGDNVDDAERITARPLSEAELNSFAGTYWSEELETQYTIVCRNGKLIAMHIHHGEFALKPMAADVFLSEQWFAPKVRFLRDASGRITAMTLGGGRVEAVRFVRK